MRAEDMKVGQVVYWDHRPVTVTKVGLPGEYGPRVELDGRMVTTPGLDHRLTASADEPHPPSLSSCMWGKA